MKIGVSFYYVGDLKDAIEAYTGLLGIAPSNADADWARFDIEGTALGLHLDSRLPRIRTANPVRYGAIVSLSVGDIRTALETAGKAGFTQAGEVQDRPYGLLAQIRDPWGNRLSLIQP